MAFSGPTSGVKESTVSNIFNVLVSLANTETMITIPNKTKKFTLKARTAAKLQCSFTSGTSNTDFITLLPGAIWTEDLLNLNSTNIYLRTDRPNITIEFLTWGVP